MNLKHRKCNLCESNANRLILTEKLCNGNDRMDFHIVKCLKCGFVYVNPIDLDHAFSAYPYAWGPSAEELFYDQFEQKRVINKLLLNILKNKLAQEAKVLDVGCGAGAFLFYIKNKFHNIFGVDASRRQVSHAQSLGLNVIEGYAEFVDTYFDSQFDAIIMSDVLEHLEDPSLVLSKSYSLLGDNGLLLLRIPNGDFQICKAKLLNLLKGSKPRRPEKSLIGSGEHLSHFNANTIIEILQKNGFKKIKLRVSPAEPYKSSTMNLFKYIYIFMSMLVHKTFGLMIGNAIIVSCAK